MPRNSSDPLISGSGLFDAPQGNAPAPPTAPPPTASAPPPLTVTEACARVRSSLDQLGTISVVGEISNFSARNHWYFSVKDSNAVLNCVMWERATHHARVEPANGMEVVVTGRLTYYPPAARTQLVVESIERRGVGGLQQRFEELCRQLRAEGYFAEERKRDLPALPRRVAVVTSRKGAALQDVLRTARMRAPFVGVVVVEVPVQGEGSAAQVARAIRAVDRRASELAIDAIIVTRGGGSLEDLWAFNERVVADAVFACRTPVVAAIGHEVDVTIIELVADRRASTPTQAAMLLFPDASQLAEQLDHLAHRIATLANKSVRESLQQLAALQLHLKRAPLARLDRAARQLAELCTAFERLRPAAQHALANHGLQALRAQLARALQQRYRRSAEALQVSARQLQALGPRQVLLRGYSLTLDSRGTPLRRAADAPVGSHVTTHLAQGALSSTVTESHTNSTSLPAP